VWSFLHDQICIVANIAGEAKFAPSGNMVAFMNGSKISLWSFLDGEIVVIQGGQPFEGFNFSDDGEFIITKEETATRVYSTEGYQVAQFREPIDEDKLESIFSDISVLDFLLQKGCARLQNYLIYGDEVTDDDRQMCNIVLDE
jgi:hypothetical protein